MTGTQFGSACILLAIASALLGRPFGPSDLVIIAFLVVLVGELAKKFGATSNDKPKV